MKISNSNQLQLKLKGKDAVHFVSAIKKIVEEEKVIGFKKGLLDEDEIKVIQKLADKITAHE